MGNPLSCLPLWAFVCEFPKPCQLRLFKEAGSSLLLLSSSSNAALKRAHGPSGSSAVFIRFRLPVTTAKPHRNRRKSKSIFSGRVQTPASLLRAAEGRCDAEALEPAAVMILVTVQSAGLERWWHGRRPSMGVMPGE